jgi:hypothetical protein
MYVAENHKRGSESINRFNPKEDRPFLWNRVLKTSRRFPDLARVQPGWHQTLDLLIPPKRRSWTYLVTRIHENKVKFSLLVSELEECHETL